MAKCDRCKIREGYEELYGYSWEREETCPFRYICRKEDTDGKQSKKGELAEPHPAEAVP